jgi:hypothetical protein
MFLLYVVILATLIVSLGDLITWTKGHIVQELALRFPLAFLVLLETEWWKMKVIDQKTKASGEAITIFSMDLAELPRTSGMEEIPFRRYQLYDLWHTLSVMLATVAFYVVLIVPHYLIKMVLNPGRDTK